MGGRRILAVIAAVAMVVVAVVIRNGRDGDAGNPSTGSGALKLLCATELESVCSALNGADVSVTIEPAAVTADRLRAAHADDQSFDGWITPGLWSSIVDAQRGAVDDELFADSPDVLGRSPFVLAVWKDQRAKLNCPEPLDLGCIGDAVNSRGFRLGVAADDEAEGVLADAALSAGHIDNANFATNDLQETDLADWLTSVDQRTDRVAQNPGGRSFTELLTFGAANADGYLSTEANIGPELIQASRRNELEMLYTRPVATEDVTFARRPGKRGDQLRDIVVSDRVRKLLAEAGWRVEGQSLVAGVSATPRLPTDDGLPSGGVLSALLEITR